MGAIIKKIRAKVNEIYILKLEKINGGKADCFEKDNTTDNFQQDWQMKKREDINYPYKVTEG